MDYERDPAADHLARLRIDQGDLNLLNPDGVAAIHDAIAAVPEDVSVLVIRGDGPDGGLSAGLDLSAARDLEVSEARGFIREIRDMIRAARDHPAVTVCGCGGYAMGAALELAMACDVRVATSDAALGLPEIDVGIVTGIQGGLLVPLVGIQEAKELMYTGEPVSGTDAEEIGLVNDAVPPEEYDETIDDWATTLAEKSPPVLQDQKRVFQALRSVGLERGMDHSLEIIAAGFDRYDQTEAMDAFLEDREPEFEGR